MVLRKTVFSRHKGAEACVKSQNLTCTISSPTKSSTEEKWAQSPMPSQEAIHKSQLEGEGKSAFFNELTIGISTTLMAAHAQEQ